MTCTVGLLSSYTVLLILKPELPITNHIGDFSYSYDFNQVVNIDIPFFQVDGYV